MRRAGTHCVPALFVGSVRCVWRGGGRYEAYSQSLTQAWLEHCSTAAAGAAVLSIRDLKGFGTSMGPEGAAAAEDAADSDSASAAAKTPMAVKNFFISRITPLVNLHDHAL